MLKITKNQGSIQVTADQSGFYPFDGTLTFPTNSLFTATSANTDMITFKSTSNGDVQFVGNYKDITISGRSYDTKQKFLTAFSNLANQGSVDAYTKAETDAKLKDKLTAQKNAKGALFISSYSNDDADSSVALYDSTVKGTNDIAIGFASTPNKDGSQNIAIGANRRCDGDNNVGIGTGRYSTTDVFGSGNVCIGQISKVHTEDNTAVDYSIAIGSQASASNNYCTVIGPSASSISEKSVTIGYSAYADSVASRSVAVGSDARAHGENSVALGYLSYATNETPLEICCGKTADNSPLRVLQSDATGKLSILKGDGTIERMVIQDEIEALKNAGGSGGTVDGLVIDANKVTVGLNQNNPDQSNLVIIGNKARAYNSQSTVIGANAMGGGSGSTAIGYEANCTDEYTIALGYKATTDGNGTIAIGPNAKIKGFGDVVIGNKAESTGGSSVAIGYNASSSARYGLSIGYEATTDDTTPLVIKAGKDSKYNPLTVLQSDSNGKLSILKGDGTDERIVISDEIAALKAEIAALKGGASTGDTTGA